MMIKNGRIIPLMKKNAVGSTINKTLLKNLLRYCDNLINEECMPHYYGRLMGIMVDWTQQMSLQDGSG
jgi:hypothetical protein